mmetsp:Transcript_917/g.3500  ORF Transcript_917/g.3500 Transcript_917/m.3500 type:complete len:294 (-) Transcript_917:11059-11940(-)
MGVVVTAIGTSDGEVTRTPFTARNARTRQNPVNRWYSAGSDETAFAETWSTTTSTPRSKLTARGPVSAPNSVSTVLKQGASNVKYAGSSGASTVPQKVTVRRPWSPVFQTPESTTSFGTNQSLSVNRSVAPDWMVICRSLASTGTLSASSSRLFLATAFGFNTFVALVASNRERETTPIGFDFSTMPTEPGGVATAGTVALAGSSKRITPATPFPRENPGTSLSTTVTCNAPAPKFGFKARYPGSSVTCVTTCQIVTSRSPSTAVLDGNRREKCAAFASPGTNVCVVGNTTPR